MTNTERLYLAMKNFTDKRRENRNAFLQRKKAMESYKGSSGYEKDLAAAQKVRTDADAVIRAECQKTVSEVLDDMAKKNATRKVEIPTDEQIRLLTVARMIKKPTREALDSYANSLDGNALALAALTDIARDAWKDDPAGEYIPTYEALAARELSAGYVREVLRNLGDSCAAIMNGSGADRIREMGASRSARVHGGSYDPDDLPQESPYQSEADFYKRELNFEQYNLFAQAVN